MEIKGLEWMNKFVERWVDGRKDVGDAVEPEHDGMSSFVFQFVALG